LALDIGGNDKSQSDSDTLIYLCLSLTNMLVWLCSHRSVLHFWNNQSELIRTVATLISKILIFLQIRGHLKIR